MMRIVLLIGSTVLVVSACSVDPGPVPDVPPPALAALNLETDAAVLQTALDKTLRVNVMPAPAVVVLALDRTVSVCPPVGALANHLGCISYWDLQALTNPVSPPRALMFEGLLTPTQRAQLVGAFWKRNEASHPIPPAAIDNATMVPPRDFAGRAPRFDVPGGVVAFSAPAYNGDGQALVYLTYRCGELCSYGWFVLLERRPGGWDIAGHRLLWIS